jgi:hypothetical protein
MFNNCVTTVKNVTCEFYLGMPVVSGGTVTPPPGSPFGTQQLASLSGGARGTVSLDMPLTSSDDVTVVVSCAGQSAGNVYWGVYPQSAYADGPAMTERIARASGRLVHGGQFATAG